VREGSRLRGFPVFGAAMAGLVLGHTISYLIAVPDPHQRQFVLQETGHGYMPALTQVALMAAVACIAALVARAFGRRGEGTETFPALARTLAVVQVVAFVGQEVLERVVAHAPLHTLGHDHVLATGVAVQITVALLAARILVWITRASARLAAAITTGRPEVPRPGRVLIAMVEGPPLPRRPLRARQVRAPPAG
jgi:hypothetical protein